MNDNRINAIVVRPQPPFSERSIFTTDDSAMIPTTLYII